MKKTVDKNHRTSNQPIGVFDSGMGGLTVLRALTEQLPQESYIYLGDTARLPYGTKSETTVRQYAKQMASLLMHHHIKLLVVACNTASTAALPHLKECFPNLPMIGVVEPGAQAAIAATRKNKIALLATETTVNSGIYQNILHAYDPHIEIFVQSCGLLVSLAEEGFIEDDIAYAVLKKYLTPIIDPGNQPDCTILGCTHFPVFAPLIKRILGTHVHIVDSAKETARAVSQLIQTHHLQKQDGPAYIQFLVTDLPERFSRIGKIFFGKTIPLSTIERVDGHGIQQNLLHANRKSPPNKK